MKRKFNGRIILRSGGRAARKPAAPRYAPGDDLFEPSHTGGPENREELEDATGVYQPLHGEDAG